MDFLPLDNVSQDIINALCNNIAQSILQSQSFLITLLCDRKAVPHYDPISQQSVMTVDRGEYIQISPIDTRYSYFLDGLSDSTIVIASKINHLLIRDCKNIHIDILKGTVSGIDILYGSDIQLTVPMHNMTNLEMVSDCHLHGPMNEDSKVQISNSWYITMNGQNLPAHPFNCLNIDQVGIRQVSSVSQGDSRLMIIIEP